MGRPEDELVDLIEGIPNAFLGFEVMRRVTSRGILRGDFVWSPDAAALIGGDVKLILEQLFRGK